MSKVEIYTTPICPYCVAAKGLLKRKGIAFEEISVVDSDRRRAMTERAHGRRTVPQIFVGATHVGGYDDIAALERDGELDELLQAG